MTAMPAVCDTDLAAILQGKGPRQPIEAFVCKFENLCSALLERAEVMDEVQFMDFNVQQKEQFCRAMDEVEFKYADYMQYSEEARAVCYQTRIDAALDELEAAVCEHLPGVLQVRELYEAHMKEMQKKKTMMQDLEHVQ